MALLSYARPVPSLSIARRVPRGIRWQSTGHDHLPFNPRNIARPAFKAKLFGFLFVPFSIPFGAAWWQIRKSGGAL